ncbi:MAG TPA: hypothetical protein VG370_13845 [Chloroflexota bacterium]|jgi:hypothetical protein|nr:hypothetical protein [Chloroflexota bacterium]
MATDAKLTAALDTLRQYREEGVVLTSAVEHLRAQPELLAAALRALDPSDPDRLAQGFVDLRQRFAHTRQLLDVAVDFLDKAVEELGHTPPYRGKAEALRVVAEEQP